MTRAYCFVLLNLWISHVFAQGESLNTGFTHSELMRVSAGLGLIIVLIFCFSWLLKKLHRYQQNKCPGISILSSCALGTRERLFIIKVSKRYLLVGATSTNISLLCDMGEEVPEEIKPSSSATFTDLFKKTLGNVQE